MWEYKTEVFGVIFLSNKGLKKKTNRIINENANNGWEVVNFQSIGLGTDMMIVFKREKQTKNY